MNQNCTDRPMDGVTGNPFRRPLLYWPVRATVRSVDSTLALIPPMKSDDELPNHATFILNFLEMVRRQEATSAR